MNRWATSIRSGKLDSVESSLGRPIIISGIGHETTHIVPFISFILHSAAPSPSIVPGKHVDEPFNCTTMNRTLAPRSAVVRARVVCRAQQQASGDMPASFFCPNTKKPWYVLGRQSPRFWTGGSASRRLRVSQSASQSASQSVSQSCLLARSLARAPGAPLRSSSPRTDRRILTTNHQRRQPKVPARGVPSVRAQWRGPDVA